MERKQNRLRNDRVMSVTAVSPNTARNVGRQSNDASQGEVTETEEHLVQTENGKIRGVLENKIVKYFDIPYGNISEENPFQESIAPLPWEAVLEKTEHTSKCPQIDSENKYIGSIDCLTLSVFVPEDAANADVLFHIHDSSLNTGSGDPLIYDPNNLVTQGIILVLPNYRFGPLGFLCLQNGTAPGNAGLKDLYQALQWTKKNIKAFGGNDSNIVVSGSGAAGALVEYLLLSNNSRVLISKAITESGFSLSAWALDRHPLETAASFISELQKSNVNAETRNIYSIYNDITIERLVRAGQGLNFPPCVENETGFLNDSPWNLLNREKLEITVMAGSANQAAMDKALSHTEESLSRINEDFSLLLPNDLKFSNVDEKSSFGRQVRTQYFGENNNITSKDMQKLSQCYSDSQYLYPGIRGARLLVKRGATVYFYEFSYGSHHPVNGSARGDSLNYVFNKNEDAAESSLKTIMSNLWASFIKSGKPSAGAIEWTNLKAVRDSEEIWLSIGETVLVRTGFHQNRLNLWNDLYQKHFVERNLSLKVNSSIYITLLSSIFLLDYSNTIHF